MTQIRFLGAAGTVTGSKYLVETGGSRVLVDCGLFQGLKALRERNWKPFPGDAASLDAVLLTHAHIDHSGYLPRLVKEGFRGRVYCTAGTQALLQLLLPDSGYLQEEQARHAARHGYSRHDPPLPLYTREEAEASLDFLEPVDFGERFSPTPDVTASYTRAGHIVGAACLSLETPHETIGFSGDVGRPVDPIMRPPEPLPPCDYLLLESTYGDRRHPREDVEEVLAELVSSTAKRGGTVLVPAFAVGRAQQLIYLLGRLRDSGRIPPLPIYLDSPMAIDATEILCRFAGDHRLDAAACRAMHRDTRFTRTPEESKAIDRKAEPAVVISASGMATGGRVLHHLRRFLPDERNAVLLVGFQAAGTRGRSLQEGTEELKIHGEYVAVKARVLSVSSLSAHADYAELLDWLRASKAAPRRVFVTHGEPAASDALRRRLRDHLGLSAVIPEDGASWALDPVR